MQGEEHPRVLVVEDDPAQRELMRGYLEGMGLGVGEASGGRAAIRLLAEGAFDLVCLDLTLPELSGYEICEYIQRTPRLAGLPIVVISARSMPVDRALAEEVGASAYLIKPFSEASFAKQVRALLPTTPAQRKQAS